MGFKVMQIETSNYCSLKCFYCPHPTQARPMGDMTMATFRKCMRLVERSDNPPQSDGRKFVWLNHFGEPLLNPQLPDFIAYATGCGIRVSFATNGLDNDGNLFPRSLWQELARAGLQDIVLSRLPLRARRRLHNARGQRPRLRMLATHRLLHRPQRPDP